MVKNSKEALAQHIGWDRDELKEYRYHAGHTNLPVYSIGDGFMAATRANQKPPKHRSMDFEWIEVKDAFINAAGYKIWKS